MTAWTDSVICSDLQTVFCRQQRKELKAFVQQMQQHCRIGQDTAGQVQDRLGRRMGGRGALVQGATLGRAQQNKTQLNEAAHSNLYISYCYTHHTIVRLMIV